VTVPPTARTADSLTSALVSKVTMTLTVPDSFADADSPPSTDPPVDRAGASADAETPTGTARDDPTTRRIAKTRRVRSDTNPAMGPVVFNVPFGSDNVSFETHVVPSSVSLVRDTGVVEFVDELDGVGRH
jgi:hypothetical protein